MKKIVLSLFLLILCTISAMSQISTYTTKIGDFKGPVKMVVSSSDHSSTVDYFNPDGTIQKTINSAQKHYIVFEWTDNAIKQIFYERANDKYLGENQLSYSKDENSFVVSTSNGSYSWDFTTSTLTSKDHVNKVLFSMRNIDKTSEGYTSVVYVQNQQTSKTIVKTYDPDEYGNYTRLVTITSDGVEHERTLSYEYYDD